MTSSIAAIHVAKRDLGLDEDTYRAKLANITGKTSTRDMTEAERQKVLTVFRSEGFKPKADRRANGRLKLSGRFAGKLQALWIAGWNLGIFRSRDDAALEAFVKRQTKTPENPEGLSAVRFCKNANDARKAIEALKAILARDGGVDWSAISEHAPLYRDADGYRIAKAQTKILGDDLKEFEAAAYGISTVPDPPRLWVGLMNRLGERVRAAKKAGA
jgi:phage gp16-like protein